MANIKYETRQKIIAQALQEVTFARNYKQGKVKNWKINEALYYSRKVVTESSRANVDLGQMGAFVHTILAKIDEPLTFKFTKRKNAQLERVKYLNALKVTDQSRGSWDIKDIVGKKQALIYGRAIYSYFADSQDGYCSHLDNVDVYDFLIDPSAGGIDIENAQYLGDYGVVLDKEQLKEGVKSKIYLKTETERLIEGSGNTTEKPQEEVNKQNRTYDTNVWTPDKNIGNPNLYKFWRWGTTYEGQRYYLLLTERGATAIEVCPIEEKFESGLWWYWTWAAFPDLTEFWTPSFCDYVREIFMAQATSVNQLLDNAEQINKPQRIVQVGAIENMAELKYRREGLIKVKKDFDANKAFQTVTTPAITTPINVFQLLDKIQEKASGVTAGSYGDSSNNGDDKLGIYKGNQENSADRFGFLNRSYAFGYKRFAKLYEHGVKEHLIKKVAIEILGPDGVELFDVSRRDIFRKSEEFGLTVEASNAELALSENEKKTKLAFLSAQAAIPVAPGAKPIQNPQKAYELMATIAGFDEDTIRQLQDTANFGDAEIMSEADRDIERLLDGEKVMPNQAANTAYKQRFVDYMMDNQESIDFDQFTTLSNYILLLDPIIMRNMTRRANDVLMAEKMNMPPVVPSPDAGGGAIINKNGGAAPVIKP